MELLQKIVEAPHCQLQQHSYLGYALLYTV